MGGMAAAIANAAIEAVVAFLDGGTIELQDASNVEVATGTLGNPAIAASASGGVATLAAITKDDTATGGGPITKAKLKTSGASAEIEATCAESGAEITIDNDTPAAGVDVFFTSLTLSFPVVSIV